jgi:hypothetical protein
VSRAGLEEGPRLCRGWAWIDRPSIIATGLVKRAPASLNQRGRRVVAAVTFKSIVQYGTVQFESQSLIERLMGAVGHRRENVLSIYVGRVDMTDRSVRTSTQECS